MHSRLFSVFGLTTLLGSLSLVACGDSGSKGRPGLDGPPGETTPARLVRAQSCGDLETLLKADARKKLDDGIDQQIEAIIQYGGYWGYGYGRSEDFADDGSAPPTSGAPGGVNNGSGGAGGSGGSGGGTPAPTPTPGEAAGDESPGYSETNTQVKGVDEADFVETDGEHVYLLHGTKFLALGAQPNAPSLEQQVAIEGSPREMFVARDGATGARRAVIYSDVNGAAVYAAAGVEPKSPYADYGYGNDGVAVGGGVRGVAAPAIETADVVGDAPLAYAPLTKVTVLDLPDGGQPAVLSEVYFEGSYSTARRVDTTVRTVLNGGEHGPAVDYYPSFDAQNQPPPPQDVAAWVAVFEQLRAEGRATIDASVAADWLPYYFVKQGAQVSAQNLACDSYHVPGAGTTQYGLTQIQSFDVRSPGEIRGTAIVGHADVVYSNTDSVYVATHGWNPSPPQPPIFPGPFPGGGEGGAIGGDDDGGKSGSGNSGSAGTGTGGTAGGTSGTGTGGTAGGEAGTGSGGTAGTGTGGTAGGEAGTGTGGSAGGPVEPPPPTTLNFTHLHKFDLRDDPTRPLYVASGTVPGGVIGQFALDERDGFLRIATTENRTTGEDFWRTESVNHLFVLEETADGLETVGDAGELAKTESITSVRFVGDKGYVVTFLRKDPLFVFDLSNPYEPTMLGQLDIPGFSEYMHPLDDTHLLTIGQDGDANGATGQLALQIFDVSDPTRPRQAHKFSFAGGDYGYSQAQHDHKAFTYFADRQLLAFPYASSGYGPNGEYKPTSTLQVFKVDVGEGFSRLGAVDHSPLFASAPPPCGYYYFGPEVRRGLFIQDKVYSISYGGLVVNDVNNLATPLGQLNLLPYLEAPAFPGGGGVAYPGEFGDVGGCFPTPKPGLPPVEPTPEPAPAPDSAE